MYGGLTPQDEDLLPAMAVAEAGSNPEAQAGVMSVALNRALTGTYGGSTPADVITAPHQFETYGNGAIAKVDRTGPAYQGAVRILQALKAGAPDPTGGATHFYAPVAQAAEGGSKPAWAKNLTASIGGTLFYAPNGTVTPMDYLNPQPVAQQQGALANGGNALPSAPAATAAGGAPQGAARQQPQQAQGAAPPLDTNGSAFGALASGLNRGMSGGGGNQNMSVIGHLMQGVHNGVNSALAPLWNALGVGSAQASPAAGAAPTQPPVNPLGSGFSPTQGSPMGPPAGLTPTPPAQPMTNGVFGQGANAQPANPPLPPIRPAGMGMGAPAQPQQPQPIAAAAPSPLGGASPLTAPGQAPTSQGAQAAAPSNPGFMQQFAGLFGGGTAGFTGY